MELLLDCNCIHFIQIFLVASFFCLYPLIIVKKKTLDIYFLTGYWFFVLLCSIEYIGIYLSFLLLFQYIWCIFIILRKVKQFPKKNERLLVETEKSKTETIIEIAKNIQTSLLPRVLNVKNYEIVAYSKPADDVGGDYYDIIDKNGKKFAVIGDVCGHGLAAGLIMIMAQTLIHSCLQSGITDLTEVLIRVNQTLLSNIDRLQEDKYMTLTLFRFEEGGKIIHSGSHQDLLIYRHHTKKVEAIKTYGCWLGILDDISDLVRNNEIILEDGDMMLLFTDGIIEAIDKNQNRYEKDQLIKLLEENGEFQPEFVKQKVIESLGNYIIEDDVTLMVLKKIPTIQASYP